MERIASGARLGEVQRYRRFRSGQVNRTYLAEVDKGQYCVRVYQHRTPRELAFEIDLLNHLCDLPVPRLHKVGNRYYGIVSGHPATVYEYIKGRQQHSFSTRQLEQVGEFLGAFHSKTRRFHWRGRRFGIYELSERRINHIVRIARARHVPYQRYIPAMVNDLRKWRLNSRLPQGPIHVDVKPENVLFDRGRLSGVIDFDNSYMGPLMLDLATSIVWFGLVGRRIDLSRAAAVYRGYQQKRRLTTLEHRELYRVLRYKFVSHVFADFGGYVRHAVSKQYLLWLINNLYWVNRHLTISEQQFYRVIRR